MEEDALFQLELDAAFDEEDDGDQFGRFVTAAIGKAESADAVAVAAADAAAVATTKEVPPPPPPPPPPAPAPSPAPSESSDSYVNSEGEEEEVTGKRKRRRQPKKSERKRRKDPKKTFPVLTQPTAESFGRDALHAVNVSRRSFDTSVIQQTDYEAEKDVAPEYRMKISTMTVEVMLKGPTPKKADMLAGYTPNGAKRAKRAKGARGRNTSDSEGEDSYGDDGEEGEDGEKKRAAVAAFDGTAFAEDPSIRPGFDLKSNFKHAIIWKPWLESSEGCKKDSANKKRRAIHFFYTKPSLHMTGCTTVDEVTGLAEYARGLMGLMMSHDYLIERFNVSLVNNDFDVGFDISPVRLIAVLKETSMPSSSTEKIRCAKCQGSGGHYVIWGGREGGHIT